jgi:hypothetical protein
LRACAMVRLRDAIKQGRVGVSAGIPQRIREKLIDQLCRLPYHFSEAGGLRYVMMAKEKMREEGIKSPDLADALSFPFLESAPYIVRSSTGGAGPGTNSVQAAADRLRELFAAKGKKAA